MSDAAGTNEKRNVQRTTEAGPAPNGGRDALLNTDSVATAPAELLRDYARTRDLRLRDELVLLHERLVRHLASRFALTGGVTQDDLVQVGYLGLIAAIERFDPDRGISFTTFALPTIVGEIKRYLRDQT